VYTHVINHYIVTRTICDALGIPPMASAATAVQIDGIWLQPVAVTPASWGRPKLLYR